MPSENQNCFGSAESGSCSTGRNVLEALATRQASDQELIHSQESSFDFKGD
jgi:hypothetical protein